jgi:hypothetical protein
MDERQQQVNEAAERFAQSLTEAYRAVAGRSVSAQELNAQLTQQFFNGVINNLRTQAENNRALAEDLIEQQRKQQGASQQLTQESVNAYMDFLNSVFARPRRDTHSAGRATQEAGGVPPREEPPPGEERPERRGSVPTTPPGEREEPPPGEERPGRRTP